MTAIPAGRRRNISAGGFQIWDLHLTSAFMLIGLMPVIGLLLAWQPLTTHQPAIGLTMGLCVAGIALLVPFTPGPRGLQGALLREYASPFESHTILRSYRPDWLIQLAREHAFETSRARPQQDIFCAGKKRSYGSVRCLSYEVSTLTLDNENRLAVLEAHCLS